jgi:Zonular occludens toxin (Zot)
MISTQIATVDGVEGLKIKATLSLQARGTPVLGNYVILRCENDLILARINSLKLSNQIHENPTFAAYIMTHGAVPEWSGFVDIERAEVDVIKIIDLKTKEPVPMRRNPSAGTPVEILNGEEFTNFSNDLHHYCVLGEVPNTGVRATIINRHFGDVEQGGYGEARHVLICGQNGSGKTVMATMLMTAKLVAHPNMGLLMPDTAGDLSDPTKHNRGDFKWNYKDILDRAGVTIEIIDIEDIRLSSIQLLIHLLVPLFRRHLSMDGEKARTLAGRVANGLFDREVESSELTTGNIINQLRDHIQHVYAKASRIERIQDIDNLASTPARIRPFSADLQHIVTFFDGRYRVDELIRGILQRGRKVIIRLQGLSERDQEQVLRELMSGLVRTAQRLFKSGQLQLANAIVLLDEGQQWVPQTGISNEEDGMDVRAIIKRAVRETRKYGLGWWIVGQSPAGIHNDIIRQAHTKWFGKNLGVGVDRDHLKMLGESGLREYDRLMLQGGFFWMGVGQDNNVGSENMYFAVHPFSGDATQAFIEANQSLFT